MSFLTCLPILARACLCFSPKFMKYVLTLIRGRRIRIWIPFSKNMSSWPFFGTKMRKSAKYNLFFKIHGSHVTKLGCCLLVRCISLSNKKFISHSLHVYLKRVRGVLSYLFGHRYNSHDVIHDGIYRWLKYF